MSIPAALNDYTKHNEYDNRLNSGARDAPRGLPPRGIGAHNNARSMKQLEQVSLANSGSSGPGAPYGNKISIMQKPVRASQNLP